MKATAGAVSTALISLTSDISGIIAVANGGTGWAAIQSGSIPYGNGTGNLSTTTAGTSGFVLALNGTTPTWVATTTFSTGLTYAAGAVTCDTASASVFGCLTSAFFSKFNSATTTFSTGLTYAAGNVTNTGVLSLTQNGGGSTQIGALTFATTSQSTNGITTGLNITNSGGTFTFNPVISGTLAIAGGGTGQTSFGQGWLSCDGTTITASTSPTVNYLVATSTTATNSFAGPATFGNNITANSGQVQIGATNVYVWNTRSALASPSNGVITLRNNGNTDFTRLQFGGTTTAFPAFTISTTSQAISVTLADGSAGGRFSIGTTTPFWNLTVASSTGPQLALVDGTATSYAWTFRSKGNTLYIATSTATATSTTAALTFNANGAAAFGTGTLTLSAGIYTSCTALTTDANGVIGCTASDQRIKNDITSLDSTSGLAAITALNPVSFYYKDGVGKPGLKFGLIAQEVQKVFPNLVGTSSPTAYTPDGTLTVDYELLISPLIKAVQEVAAITDTFKANLIAWLGNAGNGIGNIFAGEMYADKLCAKKSDGSYVCVNGDQLATSLAGVAGSGASGGESPTPPTTGTPPAIKINGNDPATVNVGDTYADLGASVTDNVDKNINIHTFVGTTPIEFAAIDTTAPATYHIYYVATDSLGNTATATRSVIVEAQVISIKTSEATSTIQTIDASSTIN